MKYFNIISLMILMIVIITSPILAHKPVKVSAPASREQPIWIEDHKISWAAYNQLEKENEIHYYSFNVKKNEEIYISLTIPMLERLKDFNPTIALIGPGLSDNSHETDVNLNVKKDESVIIKRYEGGEPEVFFEPFTRTSYYRKQILTIKAPVNGIYYTAVFNEKNKTGKYVLAIGEKEKWEVKDIVKLPKTWWDVRIFMEKEESTYAVAVGVGLMAIYFLSSIFK
ncbi:MAG: hypothetical protein KGY44_07725 [Halanaerobiales bacterium]|nr:hypothetical protein [Halanaerobiales bacterium]